MIVMWSISVWCHWGNSRYLSIFCVKLTKPFIGQSHSSEMHDLLYIDMLIHIQCSVGLYSITAIHLCICISLYILPINRFACFRWCLSCRAQDACLRHAIRLDTVSASMCCCMMWVGLWEMCMVYIAIGWVNAVDFLNSLRNSDPALYIYS